MACNKAAIKRSMVDYATMWSGLHPNKSQTTLFRDIVPIDPQDFTDKFRSSGLSQIFVAERLRTGAGFNCNHLYRSVATEADIIVYSDDKNTIISPLGEPGRDVVKNKMAHLMSMSHTTSGPVDFNIMLPSTSEEVSDIEGRVDSLKAAVKNMVENAAVRDCGDKVVSKAERLGFDLSRGIREFFVEQIVQMSDDTFDGVPGYNLVDNSGKKLTRDSRDELAAALDEAYSVNLEPRIFIQGPNNNTQILSHMHCFMFEDGEMPDKVDQNYLDVELILEIKNEFIVDVPLIRVRTPPVRTVDEEEEPLSRTSTSRNYGNRDD